MVAIDTTTTTTTTTPYLSLKKRILMASQQFGGSSNQQPGWVPYEGTRDCSQGFCSIYCPQWCFTFFPPPPPFNLAGEDDSPSSGPAFSPLVIAIIGILASAFLLVTYYTIISRYCGRLDFLRSSSQRNRRHQDGDHAGEPGWQEEWHAPPGNGLDETLISKISVYKYKRGEGLVDGTDCSVCLSQFRDDESLRLLPKCSHAFHVRCIDPWLRSHSNCPLCRANVVFPFPVPSPAPPSAPPEVVESRPTNETVIVVQEETAERVNVVEEGCLCDQLDSESDREEEPPHGIYEVSGESSDGGGGGGRVSIADVLRSSMEEEMAAAAGEGPSTHGKREALAVSGGGGGGGGGGRSRGLHMKRSSSNGVFFFSKQSRGGNPVLPA